MIIKVKCSFVIKVFFDEDKFPWTEEERRFYVEENGCPATGKVGLVVEKQIERHNRKKSCWACALQGQNEIVK